MSDAHVEVEVRYRLGTLRLEASLVVRAGWTVLFGASGSGKSTLLRVMAGLVRPDEGRVEVRGETVCDTVAGVWVEAHRRGVRWAGQREALFPRMTVRENVGFGVGSRDDVERGLEVFGLRAVAERRPGELSGGQRQRVAVARTAMGARGKVLLLDEPFAGLDAGVRDALIGGLRTWLGETPVISVTHDVGEAFLLGAEVVRVSEGRVVGQGAVAVVLAEERARLRGLLG